MNKEGREFYRRFWETIFTAFPDYKIEKGRMYLGDDGWLAFEFTVTGRQSGPFHFLVSNTLEIIKAIPPRNHAVRIPMCQTMHVEGVLAKEMHTYYDRHSHMRNRRK